MIRYRPEIDGLRAVAVIPVILFHAGFDIFSGGYIGVDIFFVISGYLITSIILSEINGGTLSLANFYERRARRILPALFFVIIACVPVAWWAYAPRDMKDFSQSIIAALTFSSNILFWLESGYFDTTAELKPLLHTWSLAVEEQFYIFFPLFIILTWRLGKNWVLVILIIIALMSLGLAHWGVYIKPAPTFYLLPTRGWEILLGSLLAFYSYYVPGLKVSLTVRQLLCFFGLFCIVFSVFFFDKGTPFPSLYTLVPTMGTAVLIIFMKDTFVSQLLSNRFVVGLGLISYSAYLWHQPLFAFAKYRSLSELSPSIMGLLTLMTLCLAVLTWKYIECPFRKGRRISRRDALGGFAFISILLISFGISGNNTNGFESRFNFLDSINNSFGMSERKDECFDKNLVHDVDDWFCILGNKAQEISFVVVGDSHALAMLDAFDVAAKNEKKSGAFTGASGCTPFLDIYALRSDQDERDCHALNLRVYNFIVANNISKIYLVARWSYYTDGGYGGHDFSAISDTKGRFGTKQDSRIAFKKGLESTITNYQKANVEVIVIPQVPQQTIDPLTGFFKVFTSTTHSEELEAGLYQISVSYKKHLDLQGYVNNLFSHYLDIGGLRVMSLDHNFCDKKRCRIGTSRGSYYHDEDHLSLLGASLTIPSIGSTLRVANLNASGLK